MSKVPMPSRGARPPAAGLVPVLLGVARRDRSPAARAEVRLARMPSNSDQRERPQAWHDRTGTVQTLISALWLHRQTGAVPRTLVRRTLVSPTLNLSWGAVVGIVSDAAVLTELTGEHGSLLSRASSAFHLRGIRPWLS